MRKTFMTESKQLVNITIDGRPITVEAGVSIMQAAERFGVRIPRLCYHPDLSIAGACRVCIVEVEGMSHFMASCSVPVWEGMKVRSQSPEIRQARRDIVELLLDNHPMDCQTCERNANCELQSLAYATGVRERYFEGRRKAHEPDVSGKAVIREPRKCILCGRCVRVCAEVQGVTNLGRLGRGFDTFVAPAHGARMDDSVCIQCGQCINVCPTAAFLEKSATEAVWTALSNPDMHVVAQTAPSIRAAIGEGFGLEPGTPVTGKMVWALREIGFDAVFDTDFAADLTIVEESHELLKRLSHEGPLPLLTSCSPGWVNFLEKFYPDLIPNASTCKSPMSMMSALLKTWYARKQGLSPDKIFVVGVMPCVAKKVEAARPEHTLPGGIPLTDAVLTTRELIWMIKSCGIDYWNMPDMAVFDMPREEFDDPMGVASGAGDIFGATGGVMEAALRTAVAKLTGGENTRLDFQEVRSVDGLREMSLNVGDLTLNVAVANGLMNAKTILDRILRGEKTYHIVELMACPGGCIGGGGQPYPPEGTRVLDPELLRRRSRALYAIDSDKTIRRSHENPAIIKLYEEFLGEPGSRKAHELLHTSYSAKLPRGIR